jgi:hypothetical protein
MIPKNPHATLGPQLALQRDLIAFWEVLQKGTQAKGPLLLALHAY